MAFNPTAQPPQRLRVVASTPISEELIDRVVRAEPRIDFVRDQSLLAPQRFAGDHAGDPSFRRTPEQQQAFEDLVDSAQALYGVPDEQPAALRRTVRNNAGLLWVHTMPAGGGSQVKAAQLTDDELNRISFTTSAGVHAEPLAEYAVFGLLAGAKTLPRLLKQQRDIQLDGSLGDGAAEPTAHPARRAGRHRPGGGRQARRAGSHRRGHQSFGHPRPRGATKSCTPTT